MAVAGSCDLYIKGKSLMTSELRCNTIDFSSRNIMIFIQIYNWICMGVLKDNVNVNAQEK